jgi:hypothetical protein
VLTAHRSTEVITS